MFGFLVLSFDIVWPKINVMVNIQLGEIKTTFEKSQQCIPHVDCDPLFALIVACITLKVVHLIEEKWLYCIEIGPMRCYAGVT